MKELLYQNVKKYKIIMFDLDDTLSNDYENIKEAFKITLEFLKEEYTEQKFERFYKIDKQTWSDRAKGKLMTPYEEDRVKKAEWLRAYRFQKYFNDQVTYKEAVHINNIYMNGLKEKVVPQQGCLEVIKYLHQKNYKIIIATDGPLVPLQDKINKLQIAKFVNTIFSGEEVGFMKPNKNFYKGLFEKTKIETTEDLLFIGDSLEKDVKGAIENNIDICWCNYKNETNDSYKVNYEIHKLEELKNIL